MKLTKYFIWIDGASRNNPGEASAAGIVKKSTKIIAKWGIPLGIRTNNQAEYAAFLLALLWLKTHPFHSATIYTDSQLLAEQIQGNWKVRSKELKKLNEIALTFLRSLNQIRIVHIPRTKNRSADKLANEALDKGELVTDDFRNEVKTLLTEILV